MHGSGVAENRERWWTVHFLLPDDEHFPWHHPQAEKKQNRSTVMQCQAGPRPSKKKLTNNGDGACVCTGGLRPSLTGRKAASRGRVCPHSWGATNHFSSSVACRIHIIHPAFDIPRSWEVQTNVLRLRLWVEFDLFFFLIKIINYASEPSVNGTRNIMQNIFGIWDD